MSTLEGVVRKLISTAIVFAVCLMGSAAFGQQIDAGLGFSGAVAPTLSAPTSDHSPANLGSGTWISVGGNALFKKHFGVGAEVAWRASQNLYPVGTGGTFFGFQPYRPIFYDFNAVYGTQFSKAAGADLMAGIGGAAIRFYTPFFTCDFSGCFNYQTDNHFLGHFGGRLKLYPTKGSIFIAPEAHLYLINGANKFSSNRVTRFGIAIGYTFRPGE